MSRTRVSYLRIVLAIALLASVAAIPVAAAVPEIGGETRVGIIMVHYNDTVNGFQPGDDQIIADMVFSIQPGSSVHELFREMSWGAETFVGEVVGQVTIDYDDYTSCPTPLATHFSRNRDAEMKAAAALAALDPFDMLMFVYPPGNACDGSGSGINGIAFRQASFSDPDPNLFTVPEVSIYNPFTTVQTYAHEVGHLRGWGHSGVPGNAYGDHGCVMGDNYRYPAGTKLAARHANAWWKADAGYIDAVNDLLPVTALGDTSALLAPLAVRNVDFGTLEAPGTLHHVIQVDGPVSSTTYWVSYLRAKSSDFHTDSTLAHVVDRIQVHHVGQSEPDLVASLLPGESWDGDNIRVTSSVANTVDDLYVQADITTFEIRSPELDLIPTGHVEALDTPGLSEPFTLRVSNPSGPLQTNATVNLDVTLDPRVDGYTLSQTSVTVAPGAFVDIELRLQFDTVPDQKTFTFAVTGTVNETDRANPVQVNGSYRVDRNPPPAIDFSAEHFGEYVDLSWAFPEGTFDFELRFDEDPENVIPLFLVSSYRDEEVVPGQSRTYELRGIDLAGNEGPWTLRTADDPCSLGYVASIGGVSYQNTAVGSYGVAFPVPVDTQLTIQNLNPAQCGMETFTLNSDGLVLPFPLTHAATVGVAGGSSVEIPVQWERKPVTFPDPDPAQGSYTNNLSVTGPRGGITNLQAVMWYDLGVPTTPGSFLACSSDTSTTLTWNASSDAVTSVVGYELSRNGSPLITTPGLTHVDALVTSATDYEVAAVDQADNRSTPAALTAALPFGAAITPASLTTADTNPAFTVDVGNANPAACGASVISLSSTSGAAFTTTVDASVTAPAEGSAQAAGSLTSLADGAHTFQVDIAGASAQATFTVDTTAPTPPGSLSYVLAGSLTLNWSAASDATTSVVEYEVRRGSTLLGTTSDLTFVDLSPPATRPLTYKVKAVDEVLNKSANATVTLPAGGSGCRKNCPNMQ